MSTVDPTFRHLQHQRRHFHFGYWQQLLKHCFTYYFIHRHLHLAAALDDDIIATAAADHTLLFLYLPTEARSRTATSN